MISGQWASYLALLVSGGALALEVRRWIESGVRLRLSLMADAIEFPDDDGQKKAVLTVENYGSAPTTLTHFVVYTYQSVFHRLLRKPKLSGFVNTVSLQKLPHKLDLAGIWMGRLNYDDRILEFRNKGQLYLGVMGTHRKNPILIKVPTEDESRRRIPDKLRDDDDA